MGDPADPGQPAQRQVHGNPEVARLQHPHDRYAERLPRPPQHPSGAVSDRAHGRVRRRHPARQRQCIGHHQQQHRAERELLERGMAGRAGTGHAVVGEHGDHASGHDGHDEEHDIERQPDAEPSGHRDHPEFREVHRQRGARYQQQQSHEEVVAAVAGSHERNRERDGGDQWEGGVDDRGGPAKWRDHQDAPGHPQQGEGGERHAGRRRAAGPVAPGREEKAHHHGEGEAEKHLVRVPHRPLQVGASEHP